MFCRCERSRRSCHREDNAGSTNSCAVIGATLCHFEGLDLWASESRNKYRYKHEYKYNWKFKKNKHSYTLGDLILRFGIKEQIQIQTQIQKQLKIEIKWTLWGISFVSIRIEEQIQIQIQSSMFHFERLWLWASEWRHKYKYKYRYNTQSATLRDQICEHQNQGSGWTWIKLDDEKPTTRIEKNCKAKRKSSCEREKKPSEENNRLVCWGVLRSLISGGVKRKLTGAQDDYNDHDGGDDNDELIQLLMMMMIIGRCEEEA